MNIPNPAMVHSVEAGSWAEGFVDPWDILISIDHKVFNDLDRIHAYLAAVKDKPVELRFKRLSEEGNKVFNYLKISVPVNDLLLLPNERKVK